MLRCSAEYDRLQCIFNKLDWVWQLFLKWTDYIHVHLQVNGQRADTRKILSGSCIFLTLWAIFADSTKSAYGRTSRRFLKLPRR